MKPQRKGPRWIALACACLIGSAISCSRQAAQPKTVAEMVAAHKSSQELAEFVFENHNCKNCHTLGKEGKFAFTSWGAQVRQKSEGCIALLTAMNGMINVPDLQLSSVERIKKAHFKEYGCDTCHQITPGKMGLTEVGEQLRTAHLGCVEVQNALNKSSDQSRN